MPPYANIPSPSLRKMNGQDPSQRGGAYGSSGRFDFGNIVGDPFALATISVSIIAWLIAVVAGGIAHTQSALQGFVWWAAAYGFLTIIFVTTIIGFNLHSRFQIALVGYLAAGLVKTCLAVNHLVYAGRSAREAAAAGYILFAMVQLIWIGYFGQTQPAAYSDSYPMGKDSKYGNDSRYRPETSASSHQAPQMYTSAQLGGNFETVNRSSRGDVNNGYMSGTTPPSSTPTPGPMSVSGAITPDGEVSQPTEYPYRAKAMYSYEANPEDANEISFQKGDVLDVWDVSGRWWQARKANGETGIAPSNYLMLLS